MRLVQKPATWLLAIGFAVVSTTSAAAKGKPKPHAPAHEHLDRQDVGPNLGFAARGALRVSAGVIGEDVGIIVNAGAVLSFGRFKIAPRLPLRLKIVDSEPTSGDVVRKRDWDELSDFAREKIAATTAELQEEKAVVEDLLS